MTVYSVTVPIDTELLRNYTDRHLATLWHVGQANPADLSDVDAGRIAESIGREIIRRFLANTEPELYTHQGHHAPWHELSIVRGISMKSWSKANDKVAE